jgi:very-short-patch-repair endonuclease
MFIMQKCEHNKQQYYCRECGGKGICEHNNRAYCKECGGSQICPHNIQKSVCKECKGKGICKHDKCKTQCIECALTLHAFCRICKKVRVKKNCNYLCSNCNPDKSFRTETIVLEFLKEKYKVTPQKKFDWCKNKTHLPFDFCIESLNVIIEIDGEQHFKQIGKWESPDFRQSIDFYKMKCLFDNNYRIIRIYQPDIYFNNINWKLLLQNAINTMYKCQYISFDNNLYNNYKKLFKNDL